MPKKTHLTDTGTPDRDRRRFLGVLGAAGAGLALSPALGGGSARAGAQPGPKGVVVTRLQRVDAGRIDLRTGPYSSTGAPFGSRVAVAFLLPGAGPQAPGELSLANATVDGALVGPGSGQTLAGLDGFERDLGVDRAVHALLTALSTPRPVGIHGFSAAVAKEGLDAGLEADVAWSLELRGAHDAAQLLEQLRGFHAIATGLLAPDGGFAGLSFTTVTEVL